MIERPAKCLPVLRAQLDAAYPNRKHTVDYYKGDPAHAARKSDHNPDSRGIIHAYDVTHDPANGCDVQALADAIIESRDLRMKYMIHNRRIVSSTNTPWQWRPHGDDPHLGHLHLSVSDKNEDDTRPWQIKRGVRPTAAPKQPNYRSLAGGFFSADPFDNRMPTSIRTNNPGALNASPWVKAYPGYVGDKVTSMSGASANNTAIFETPEQGVAVWHELMKRYATAGAVTVEKIINKYGGGQDYSAYVAFVTKQSGLPADYKIGLTGSDDYNLMKFARAMWHFEAGRATPLSNDQIVYGFKLARKSGGNIAGGLTGGVIIGGGIAGANEAQKAGYNPALIGLGFALAVAIAITAFLLVRKLMRK